LIEREGARLAVDKDAMDLVQDSVVDYTQEMIRRAFVVQENPHADRKCGCGASFSPKGFS